MECKYITEEFIYPYTGWAGVDSKCHIRILEDNDKPTVYICSQLPGNIGTSITNMAENIAKEHIETYLRKNNFKLSKFLERYYKDEHTKQIKPSKILDDIIKLLKEKNLTVLSLEIIKIALQAIEDNQPEIIWVEHYPKGTGISQEDTYAIVNFDKKNNWLPDWTYRTLSELEEITRYPASCFIINFELTNGCT